VRRRGAHVAQALFYAEEDLLGAAGEGPLALALAPAAVRLGGPLSDVLRGLSDPVLGRLYADRGGHVDTGDAVGDEALEALGEALGAGALTRVVGRAFDCRAETAGCDVRARRRVLARLWACCAARRGDSGEPVLHEGLLVVVAGRRRAPLRAGPLLDAVPDARPLVLAAAHRALGASAAADDAAVLAQLEQTLVDLERESGAGAVDDQLLGERLRVEWAVAAALLPLAMRDGDGDEVWRPVWSARAPAAALRADLCRCGPEGDASAAQEEYLVAWRSEESRDAPGAGERACNLETVARTGWARDAVDADCAVVSLGAAELRPTDAAHVDVARALDAALAACGPTAGAAAVAVDAASAASSHCAGVLSPKQRFTLRADGVPDALRAWLADLARAAKAMGAVSPGRPLCAALEAALAVRGHVVESAVQQMIDTARERSRAQSTPALADAALAALLPACDARTWPAETVLAARVVGGAWRAVEHARAWARSGCGK
jgi:hypothetical protein